MADQKNIEVATNLMRMALGLLDKAGAGATYVACHLQAAIDGATGARPMQEGDKLSPELLARFEKWIGR